jgi:hypothetical protein
MLYALCLPAVGMALCCMKMAQDRLEKFLQALSKERQEKNNDI